MTRVLIQPAAKPEAKRNRMKTLHTEVDFQAPRLWSALTGEERSRLEALHPTGKARFWGTRSFLNKQMDAVSVGDVVLFVWENHIRAIGEVGASFRNKGFADELWRESAAEDSFVNVYSLLGLEDDLAIPYRVLVRASEGKLKGPFRQGRVIADPDLVGRVITGLAIQTGSAVEPDMEWEGRIQTQLERGIAVALERFTKTGTCYERPSRTISVHRGESILVDEYVGAHPDVTFGRFVSAVGITDMYIKGEDGAELIEAKGGAGRERVRQAVAQLLHYSQWCDDPVRRLTALFPVCPDDDDIRFLHNLGIDCAFRTGHAEFDRLDAPEERRKHMLPVWNNEL